MRPSRMQRFITCCFSSHRFSLSRHRFKNPYSQTFGSTAEVDVAFDARTVEPAEVNLGDTVLQFLFAYGRLVVHLFINLSSCRFYRIIPETLRKADAPTAGTLIWRSHDGNQMAAQIQVDSPVVQANHPYQNPMYYALPLERTSKMHVNGVFCRHQVQG